MFCKQYKATSPEETIQSIKRLLGNIGIQVKEETKSLKGLVYSVRITVSNGRISGLDLGSNGKGLTPEYALASAYAELMERLQTRLLYDDLLMLPPSATNKFFGKSFFRCAPDEVLRLPEWRFFPKQGEAIVKLHAGRIASAKMFSLRAEKAEMTPIELMRYMTGSTGACAGNTKEEAIVQGICEILERHALQKVFMPGMNGLPTVPTYMLRKLNAWEKMCELGRLQEVEFAVKDCSFGTGMPVLGLLVWNDKSYIFKLGAATSPDVALARCFTEIYQGYTDNGCLLPKNPDLMVASPTNYQRAKINGTGHFPKSIFAGQDLGTLDNFQPFEGKDINGDYFFLTKALLSARYEIYIQDCSFLGFPSYYIYIPGLSDIYPQLLDFQKRIDRCMQFTRQTGKPTLPPYNSAYKRYPFPLYAFAVSVKKKDYTSALKYFKSLIGTQIPRTPYYNAVMDFIQMRNEGMRLGKIIATIGKKYEKQVSQKVLAEFRRNADIDKTFQLPTCFKCANCPTQTKCALCDLAKLDDIIRGKQRNYLANFTENQSNSNKDK